MFSDENFPKVKFFCDARVKNSLIIFNRATITCILKAKYDKTQEMGSAAGRFAFFRGFNGDWQLLKSPSTPMKNDSAIRLPKNTTPIFR